ncbi:uncharacterized protein LOC116727977 [Xiphophorus hellerii]|uniref:uncharacterized protein LOC116727977 n=1 Tax=Xiphophorus hellerii TaxID=8084 RepID=UPI0013B3FE5B|nr:uncharacterized protein LOC116727977 [Xiphophorus hellerii]
MEVCHPVTCPLIPVFNQKLRTTNIFGKKIPYNCGYHTSNVVNIVGKRSRVQLVCFIILKKVMSHQAKHHHLCQTNIKHLNYNMGYQQLHPGNQQYFPINQQHLPRYQHFSHNSALQQCNTPTPSVASSSIPHLRPPEVNWVSFLPKKFLRVIKPADQQWIAQCLYNPTGQFKQHFSQNWFHPPRLPKITNAPPDPLVYFRQRMFLWAPMRMWGISLKCHQCNTKMHHSGIYTKVREVIDLDSRYYLIGGDYPRCSKGMIPVCPWSTEVLNQLDPAHRNRFPAILTTQVALDKRCVTLLRLRTVGNSSSYIRQTLKELHSEEWAKRTIEYLFD